MVDTALGCTKWFNFADISEDVILGVLSQSPKNEPDWLRQDLVLYQFAFPSLLSYMIPIILLLSATFECVTFAGLLNQMKLLKDLQTIMLNLTLIQTNFHQRVGEKCFGLPHTNRS